MSQLSAATRALIDRLELEPHPEGGFYRETWRSPVMLPESALPPGYPGPRAAMTAIYFLLPTGVQSRLHRVRSEELWMHHEGDLVELSIGPTPESTSSPESRGLLGNGPDASHQLIVPAGAWQTARALEGPVGHALVGCVVAPGFDFADFEILD